MSDIDLVVTVQCPQSGTTGNLMCKTQINAIVLIKPELYGSEDIIAVAHRTCTSSIQWFQILAAGHPRGVDSMTLTSKTERLLLLLGQTTPIACTKFRRMEFLGMRTSSPLWFQIVAAGHPRWVNNLTLACKTHIMSGNHYGIVYIVWKALILRLCIKFPVVPDCCR